jgi:hypothetical protein
LSGNKKPQTFRDCAQCHKRFGPLKHLSQKLCSKECKIKAQTTGKKTFRKTITKARSAQSLLRYHVQAGNINRPTKCEQCGSESKKIEGAHKDYNRPLDVRWLCRSCHIRWDKADPKNATYVVARWEQYTGQKAQLFTQV